jgi:hypothetical protein
MWHDPTENEGLEHARTQQQVCLLTENMPISADCTHSALFSIGPWLSIENLGDLGPFLQKKPHETSDTLG